MSAGGTEVLLALPTGISEGKVELAFTGANGSPADTFGADGNEANGGDIDPLFTGMGALPLEGGVPAGWLPAGGIYGCKGVFGSIAFFILPLPLERNISVFGCPLFIAAIVYSFGVNTLQTDVKFAIVVGRYIH